MCKRQLGPPRAKLLVMRSQTYGDKQPEAQWRKKQEAELWKKSNPENAPTSEALANADKSDHTPNKTKKKDTPGRRSAQVARARRSLNFGDSYTCTYCLQVIHWDHHRTRPTRDHFFPKSKKKLLMGAKTTFIICCQPCNSRKSDKVFSSIEEVREFITSRKKAPR